MGSENKSDALEYTLAAIADTQESIRAYDSKSEILAILLTLAITFVNYDINLCLSSLIGWIVFVTSITGLISITFIGAVLFPVSNPEEEIELGDYKPKGIFFVSPPQIKSGLSVAEHVKAVNKADIQAESSYELLKLSFIRNRKGKWFLRALWAAYAVIFLIFIYLIVRTFA